MECKSALSARPRRRLLLVETHRSGVSASASPTRSRAPRTVDLVQFAGSPSLSQNATPVARRTRSTICRGICGIDTHHK
jgi:hypothetical protein